MSAVWSSTLRPTPRLVALCYADHAGRGETAWVTWERLSDRTGASRSTVARSVTQLVALGWLAQVSRPQQHRAPIYRLCIPGAAHQGCQIDTPADAQGSQADAQGSQADAQGSQADAQGSQADAQGSQADTQPPQTLGTTPPPPAPGGPDPVTQLAAAVRAGVPKHLLPSAGLRPRCEQLAADGWSADELTIWLKSQSWDGSRHGGAVVTRLEALTPQDRPTPRPTRQRSDVCTHPKAADDGECIVGCELPQVVAS